MRQVVQIRALTAAVAATATLAATSSAAWAAHGAEIMESTPQTGECVVGSVGSGVGGTESTDNGGVTAPGCVDLGALPGGTRLGPTGRPGGDPDNPLGEISCRSAEIPSRLIVPDPGTCPDTGAMRDGLARMLRNNRTNPDGCTTRERIQLFYTVVIEATPHRGECVTPAGTIRPESAQILF